MKDVLDPTQTFLVTKIMASLHENFSTVDIRLPVTHSILKRLISSVVFFVISSMMFTCTQICFPLRTMYV